MGINRFKMHNRRQLVNCALGQQSADLVIRNGKWVCVQSGEVLPGTDVAILGERVAYVGPDAGYTIGPSTHVIEAGGRYLVPGLLDAHMHVESGMLTVSGFTRTVIPHGTTAMFIDPHEIANVFGMQGVRLMLDEALNMPVHVFVQIPSCVPSAPGLETPGATITPEEIEEALDWDGVIGLGELMNFPAVLNGEEGIHRSIEAALQRGKKVGGHYPPTELDKSFSGYMASGVGDDHECTTLSGAMARIRQGIYLMMRQGSAWLDIAVLAPAVTEKDLDPRRFVLCSDDSHSHTLFYEGHMDRVVRFAISQGIAPMKAVQMATINPADYFGLSSDIGMIAPGRYADILLVEELEKFVIDMVFARGKLVADSGNLIVDIPGQVRPAWLMNSIKMKRPLQPADFRLLCQSDGKPVFSHVIGVLENQAPTSHLRYELQTVSGEIRADIDRDIAKIAMIERHHATGRVQVGLVQGFGFNVPCAVASTVSHDCHHLVVVGTDDTNMSLAANLLAECGGGQIVVREGRVVGKVELPIAGLMSDEPAEIIANKAATVLQGFQSIGCKLNNPNMQLSLLGLAVIPQLRLTDLGLVDVDQFSFIPVLEL